MTGFDFAAMLRRRLNDKEASYADGDILDAINLGLAELGRELNYWTERWEFEANEDGLTALPDRFLEPLSVRLNGKEIAIRPSGAKVDEFGVSFEGFEVRTLKGAPIIPPPNVPQVVKPPYRYKVIYKTFAQIGGLAETLPIATAMLDLLLEFCALVARERTQWDKSIQDLKLQGSLYSAKLEQIRSRLNRLRMGKRLTTRYVIC
jgi:hypothetical protein